MGLRTPSRRGGRLNTPMAHHLLTVLHIIYSHSLHSFVYPFPPSPLILVLPLKVFLVHLSCLVRLFLYLSVFSYFIMSVPFIMGCFCNTSFSYSPFTIHFFSLPHQSLPSIRSLYHLGKKKIVYSLSRMIFFTLCRELYRKEAVRKEHISPVEK